MSSLYSSYCPQSKWMIVWTYFGNVSKRFNHLGRGVVAAARKTKTQSYDFLKIDSDDFNRFC